MICTDHDPATGRLTLTAPARVTAGGVTVAREAGYTWHAGKRLAVLRIGRRTVHVGRIRNPSPAMIEASYFHDGRYDDAAWTMLNLTRADLLFALVYWRAGGRWIVPPLVVPWLLLWSTLTALYRAKPLSDSNTRPADV